MAISAFNDDLPSPRPAIKMEGGGEKKFERERMLIISNRAKAFENVLKPVLGDFRVDLIRPKAYSSLI